MRKRLAQIALILIACTLGAAAQPAQTLTRDLNSFAVSLYRQLCAGRDNLAVSPVSIGSALSMTALGARGPTAEEIYRGLQLADGASAHEALGYLLSDLQLPSGGEPGPRLANRIWPHLGAGVRPAFQEQIRRHYAGTVQALDYRYPEVARKQINDWVADRTEQHILNLIPSGALDNLTRVVLTNALYFKASWRDPFDPHKTSEGNFYPTPGQPVRTPLMSTIGTFGYRERNGLQIAELVYTGERFSMLVILPASLTELEQELSPASLQTWLSELEPTRLSLTLPRFRSSQNLSLTPALKALGIKRAFSRQADFQDLSEDRQLHLTDVFHQAFIAVDEAGTEAAAASAAVLATRSAALEDPVEFRADRPFLYSILDRKTGVILFLGRLVRP